MNLQLACAWLNRDIVGFSEIHQFAAQCCDAAREPTRESAALVLLAEAVGVFAERQEGGDISREAMREFLTQIHTQAAALRDASTDSDAQFVVALNRFAAFLAKDLYV